MIICYGGIGLSSSDGGDKLPLWDLCDTENSTASYCTQECTLQKLNLNNKNIK